VEVDVVDMYENWVRIDVTRRMERFGWGVSGIGI
jgi:hypothetical protein